jgi:TetR/AcrR family transcriptional regulator, ethionamide resistance regulator
MRYVTRRHQSNRAERLTEIRDRLLVAAERLLEQGEPFSEISVERLSSEAGMTRTTFYVYFEDKADVLLAWFDQVMEEVESSAESLWQLDLTATRDDLRHALERVIRSHRPHTLVLSAVYDASLFDAAVRDALQAMMDRNIGRLRALIERGQEEGWIDPEAIAHETATWLGWMLWRGQQTMRPRDDADRDALASAYTDVFWNTLVRPAKTGILTR